MRRLSGVFAVEHMLVGNLRNDNANDIILTCTMHDNIQCHNESFCKHCVTAQPESMQDMVTWMPFTFLLKRLTLYGLENPPTIRPVKGKRNMIQLIHSSGCVVCSCSFQLPSSLKTLLSCQLVVLMVPVKVAQIQFVMQHDCFRMPILSG